MKYHRSSNRLVMDLLRALQRHGPVGVTRLLTAANLTHGRLQGMLKGFEENGWAIQQTKKGQATWTITGRGERVLADLTRIDDVMQDHGLGL